MGAMVYKHVTSCCSKHKRQQQRFAIHNLSCYATKLQYSWCMLAAPSFIAYNVKIKRYICLHTATPTDVNSSHTMHRHARSCDACDKWPTPIAIRTPTHVCWNVTHDQQQTFCSNRAVYSNMHIARPCMHVDKPATMSVHRTCTVPDNLH